jgi:hypothetical protein
MCSEFCADIVAHLLVWTDRCELLSSAQVEKALKVNRQWQRRCQQQTGDICAGLTLSIKYWKSHQTRIRPLPHSCRVQIQHISADEQRVWTNVVNLLRTPPAARMRSLTH